MRMQRSKLGLFLLLLVSVAHAYQALIFDCDGVLVDSEQHKFQAWHTALAEQAIDFPEHNYLPLVGYDSKHIARAIAAQSQRPFDQGAIIKRKNQLYQARQQQGITPLPDAVAFLKLAIKQKEKLGFKIAIASSAPKQEILENLRQLQINPADLDYIISGSDDLRFIQDPEGVNKPKPYIYQICAKQLGIEPQQCLVFEDSSAGVDAAFYAGMDVIAIPNRYTAHQNFNHALKVAQFNEFDIARLQEDLR